MQVTIKSLNHQGFGEAILEDGQKVTVPYTLTGETVDVEVIQKNKHGYKANLNEVVSPSPQRSPAPCQHFTQCGGCALQHLNAESYSAFKRTQVQNALAQHNIETEVLNLIILPAQTRRRAKFMAHKNKNKVEVGFRAAQSHQLVAIRECHVIHPQMMDTLKPLTNILHRLMHNKQSAEIYASYTSETLDILIDLGKSADLKLGYEDRESIASTAKQAGIARLRVKDKNFTDLMYMATQPVVTFNNTVVETSCETFLQASEDADAKLQQIILSHLKKMKIEKVCDLFCGRGTLSFAFDEGIQVDGYEADKPALTALNSAAQKHKKSVKGIYQNLYQTPLSAKQLNQYDCIVLDPPRDGAKKQIVEIAQSQVQTVVYVSCNPKSFAQDAKVLMSHGYQISAVQPIDQFLWSSHVEVVASFHK